MKTLLLLLSLPLAIFASAAPPAAREGIATRILRPARRAAIAARVPTDTAIALARSAGQPDQHVEAWAPLGPKPMSGQEAAMKGRQILEEIHEREAAEAAYRYLMQKWRERIVREGF